MELSVTVIDQSYIIIECDWNGHTAFLPFRYPKKSPKIVKYVNVEFKMQQMLIPIHNNNFNQKKKKIDNFLPDGNLMLNSTVNILSKYESLHQFTYTTNHSILTIYKITNSLLLEVLILQLHVNCNQNSPQIRISKF